MQVSENVYQDRISEQPWLAGHLSSPSGWAGVGAHCTVVLTSSGAAPKHLPRIQGSSAMVAPPKTTQK